MPFQDLLILAGSLTYEQFIDFFGWCESRPENFTFDIHIRDYFQSKNIRPTNKFTLKTDDFIREAVEIMDPNHPFLGNL